MEVTMRIAEYGVDADGQRMDRQWLEGAVAEWLKMGGVVDTNFDRVPVAKCVGVEFDDDGPIAKVEVIDHRAQELLNAGVLKGLGVSIRSAVVHKDDIAKNGLIDGGTVTGVSLLDSPMPYTSTPESA